MHASVVAAVSAAMVCGSQPDFAVTADSASLTAQVTEVLETYQPFVPSVPATVGVIAGGVMSALDGRHSQTPTCELAVSALERKAKLPRIGYHPKSTEPTTGRPAPSLVEVQPLATVEWKL